jgi:hypothetical protein
MTGYKSKKAMAEAKLEDDDTQVYQRPWVGLTEQEFQLIYDMGRTPSGMMEMVESMLEDKNT